MTSELKLKELISVPHAHVLIITNTSEKAELIRNAAGMGGKWWKNFNGLDTKMRVHVVRDPEHVFDLSGLKVTNIVYEYDAFMSATDGMIEYVRTLLRYTTFRGELTLDVEDFETIMKEANDCISI